MKTLMIAAAVATSLLDGAAWADPPAPIATRDFVQAAAGSDQFEIMEGRLAIAESRNPQIVSFARQMIEAHVGTTAALRGAASSAGLPPPPTGMSGDQAMLLGALQGQEGSDFDKTYARHQVLGHQQALAVAQDYGGAGADPSLRSVARTTIPIIQHHLDEAHRLCVALQCAP